MGGLPLGNIGNASARQLCQRLGANPRRFRFAGEKEAAGAVAAVIEEGIMEIECRWVIGKKVFAVAVVADVDGKR
jgi:hypothetical protein